MRAILKSPSYMRAPLLSVFRHSVSINISNSPAILQSELTGYELAEIIGRNCVSFLLCAYKHVYLLCLQPTLAQRFLQAPHGILRKGETRAFTDDKPVGPILKSLATLRECQLSSI